MSAHRHERLSPSLRRPAAAAFASVMLTIGLLQAALARPEAGPGTAPPAIEGGSDIGHLLISEVMTGGASASDEFIELYNPSAAALPTEGLELVYVTASGATVTRKFAWPGGAAPLAPGAHLLIANEAGAFAAVADGTYASGLAATGGSVALRIVGAATAVDAVGWGSAASTWLEAAPAPAPATGHSLERLPGGAAGSGQDTDQNAADFVERDVPDPQNSTSTPIAIETPMPTPVETPMPTPVETPMPTPEPTPSPTPTPTPVPSSTPQPTVQPISVQEARALADGEEATIEGVALTSSDFTDGGGYVADTTGGIAVLIADGAFARGAVVRVSGTLDDRYQQRTIRANASGVAVMGQAADPVAVQTTTGLVGEALEGRLVAIAGVVQGAPTSLSAGLAFDVDDGSGAVRVLVGATADIDTAGWVSGSTVALHGVVGQRDSTGTGTSGYRVQPRDAADISEVSAPATPTPTLTPTPAPSDGSGATPTPAPTYETIAQARSASVGSLLTVRGVVTMPPGLVDPDSAFLQDGSGAILLRLGEDARDLQLGQMVEVQGIRSTKSGMEALRVSDPPVHLGQQSQPALRRASTGALGETDEALLVAVRGAVASTPQKSSAQNVYFDLDDGSGPIRVYLSPRIGIGASAISRGAWLEIVGVLAQETTGKQPERGYRIWPRQAADVTLLAASVVGGTARTTSGATPVAPGRTDNGIGGTGDPAPTLLPGMIPPRLAMAIPTPPAAGPTFAPPAPEPVVAGGSPVVPVLLMAAMLLAAAGALAVRPGLPDRIGAAIAGLRPARPAERAAIDAEASAERVGPGVGGAPPLLVPLAVVDAPQRPRRTGPSVIDLGSRRESGRILPPT